MSSAPPQAHRRACTGTVRSAGTAAAVSGRSDVSITRTAGPAGCNAIARRFR